MFATITHEAAEADVRDFCAEHVTPNTVRLLELAESGRITWVQARGVLVKAINDARLAVAE